MFYMSFLLVRVFSKAAVSFGSSGYLFFAKCFKEWRKGKKQEKIKIKNKMFGKENSNGFVIHNYLKNLMGDGWWNIEHFVELIYYEICLDLSGHSKSKSVVGEDLLLQGP